MIDIQKLMDNLFDGSGIEEGLEGDFSKVIECLEKAELAHEAGVSVITQLQMAEAILAIEQVCHQRCRFEFEDLTNLLNVKSAVEQRQADVGPPEELGENDLSRIEQSLKQLYRQDPQEAQYRAAQIEKRFGHQIDFESPQRTPEPEPEPEIGPEGSGPEYWDEDEEI